VSRRSTLPLFLAAPVLLCFLSTGATLRAAQQVKPLRWAGAEAEQADRAIFLAGQMSSDEVVAFTTTVAASGHPGVVLFDTPRSCTYTRAFLEQFRPTQLHLCGNFVDGAAGVAKRLKTRVTQHFRWERGPAGLAKALFPRAPRVVLAPAEPRRLLLHAGCLAGALQAPLLVVPGNHADLGELGQMVQEWEARQVYVVGQGLKVGQQLGGATSISLADEERVQAVCLEHLSRRGPVTTLVVANPADTSGHLGDLSCLAPWTALQRHAALVLTNEQGTDVEAAVQAACKRPELRHADTLILVGSLEALPTHKRPNPMEGGRDVEIEMEPLTPPGFEPCSFATGRLFHSERNVLALMLARPRLFKSMTGRPKALIVSNPGGGLPLLETFSRHTAIEFKNAGYDTTAFIGRGVSREEVKRLMPQQTVFLWEGHNSTLVRTYAAHLWPEPLSPSLIFLQSCLALSEPIAQPFLLRGAVGVVGSATRTYSGSGGAFALAFFDALLYEDRTVGSSLRHAKNFMLAFARLKEKRLGDKARLTGANLRAAWAFTLWGDPTVKLPRPALPEGTVPSVTHAVRGNAIVVRLPKATHEKVSNKQYQASMHANGRLAGLRSKKEEEDGHRLVPFVFVEVDLPGAAEGKTPRLTTRLPGKRWVFCWEPRCQRGYLLLTPRATDEGELRFQVRWD
jgi:hypothetical protein